MALLFIISIFVNIGMWSERLWLVASATAHDFLPHNWGWYLPTAVELTILNGSIALFFFGFLILAKFFPAAPMSDIKIDAEEEREKKRCSPRPYVRPAELPTGVVGVFSDATSFLDAVDKVHDHALYGMETYAPLRVDELGPLLGRGKSPVRYWTLIGALSGLVGGFALAIGSALVNGLIVGGKHPVSIIPYCVIGFEGTILLGALGNFIGMLVHARLPRWKTPAGYDWRFSRDKSGLFIAAPLGRFEGLHQVLESTHPEEIYDVQ